jgi:hypothetical protein
MRLGQRRTRGERREELEKTFFCQMFVLGIVRNNEEDEWQLLLNKPKISWRGIN